MKISVIMPVSLTPYPNCASNLEYKFQRAIDTYLDQDFKDSELIVVSDGCDMAEKIYIDKYLNSSVRFKKINKQPHFGGMVRQTGIEMARGEIICYLDADDIFGKKHLQIINDNFDLEKYDWVYYNDILIVDTLFSIVERGISPVPCQIGTSCIAHKRSLPIAWGDGYGHDWVFIKKHLLNKRPGIKIPTPQYYVCHCPGGGDY